MFAKAFVLSQMVWEMVRVRMLAKCRRWAVMTETMKGDVKGRGSPKESEDQGLEPTIWDAIIIELFLLLYSRYYVKDFYVLFHIFFPNNFILISQIWNMNHRIARAVEGKFQHSLSYSLSTWISYIRLAK